MEDSPLATVETLTLDQLFEKDPAELSEEEMHQIVVELRKGRAKWAEEDRAAKTQGRRAKTSKGQKLLEELQIGEEDVLEELGKIGGGNGA